MRSLSSSALLVGLLASGCGAKHPSPAELPDLTPAADLTGEPADLGPVDLADAPDLLPPPDPPPPPPPASMPPPEPAASPSLEPLASHRPKGFGEQLRYGNPSGDLAAAPRCGAATRAGGACRQPAMANGRCRLHGGKSTGPRTEGGLARSSAFLSVQGRHQLC